jgi:hypothetical protein
MAKELEPVKGSDGAAAVPAVIDEWSDVKPFVNESGEILLSGEQAYKLRRMLSAIPVPDENANERFVDQLMTGDDVLSLNAPWEAHGGRALAGKKIRIDTVEALESQFEAGLNAFIVAKGIDLETKKPVVMTSSAMMVVVQLARTVDEGWLPAYAEIVVATRPTKRGYLPYHLRFFYPGDEVMK